MGEGSEGSYSKELWVFPLEEKQNLAGAPPKWRLSPPATRTEFCQPPPELQKEM